MFLSDEGPTLKTLDFTFYIGSTPTFSYNVFFLNYKCRICGLLNIFETSRQRNQTSV